MRTQNDGRPRAGSRQGTFPIAQLGGIERPEGSVPGPATQDEARAYEVISRRRALAALCLGGALALQERALALHYGARSAALMAGRGRA